ncbi:MAG: phosphoribosylamine--glycine ligase [Eubacteriales bacterium]|nr:phosphoribosylamine--glycine ligase [Eubacteriales bacterium]
MKVLVIGGGGREHAIVHKLAQSPAVTKLYCAPGNAGIAQLAECVSLNIMDNDAVTAFAHEKQLDWVFVAPDDPLANGLVDALQNAGIKAFGPSAAAARVEASKSFAKYVMDKYDIPTAAWKDFSDAEKAKEYIRCVGAPIVVKADGLALGKGVFVCQSVSEAEAAVDSIMVQRAFGSAGARVIVEECLSGPEASVLCFTDGKTVVPMVAAQDHKRAYDGDRGPNTGGMGAFAPTPKLSHGDILYVKEHILQRAVDALSAEGCPFMGVLYAGIMMTPVGIKVIEFNARFGDPETQVILPLLRSDLMDIMQAIDARKLDACKVEWQPGAAAVVVMASEGYPGSYEKGKEISGLTSADGVTVYHAGTKNVDGRVVTNGGRVLGVTAVGNDLPQAIAAAYRGVEQIHFEGAQYRKDIGQK